MQADPEVVKVREGRHRLQKAFLSSKKTPEDPENYATGISSCSQMSEEATISVVVNGSMLGAQWLFS